MLAMERRGQGTADEERALGSTDLEPEAQQMQMEESVTTARALHDELFASFSTDEAKRVSRLEREAKALAKRSLVYGEIPFDTVHQIFQLLRSQCGALLDHGGHFCDIGSGCGKVVLAAALLHDFTRCCGIEVLDGLHAMALQALSNWQAREVADPLLEKKAGMDVEFVQGDATKRSDWRGATLVVCNATCFSDSLMHSLSNAADKLAVGTYFVTVTKPLLSSKWKLVVEQKMAMSWGPATVIVHEKTC